MDVLFDEGLRGSRGYRADPDGLGALVELEEFTVGAVEGGHVPAPKREPVHEHAGFLRDPLGKMIALPVIVERLAAGGEHLDMVAALRQARRHLEDMLLGPPHQALAEPGNDEGGSYQGRRPSTA